MVSLGWGRGLCLSVGVVGLVALQGLGCGPKEPPVSTTTIIMPGGTLADRFQGRSPRLRVAREEIGALLGHGLEIRIDAAFEPRWSLASDEHIERVVVELGRTLKHIETRNPKLFAAQKDAIRLVQYEFDATATSTVTTLDATKGVLRIVVSQDELHGCACNGVQNALFEAESKAVAGKFEGKEAEAIAGDELPAYVKWLRDREHLADGRPAKELGDPGATSLRRLIDVHERMAPSPARDELRKHLLGRLHSVSEFKSNHKNETSAPNAQSAWGRMERAYGQWLTRSAPSFPLPDKAEVVGDLARRRDAVDLVGFDLLAFGLTLVDGWLAAGMPMGRNAPDPDTKALSETVCPYWLADDGRFREHPSNCKDFWVWVRNDESRLNRAVQYLLGKRNGDLVQAVFPNLIPDTNHGSREGKALVPMWRRFSQDQASWAAATRVVGITSSPFDSEVLGEAVRVVRSEPQRRGLVLFVFATSDWGRSGTRTKEERRVDFERSYGPSITPDEFRDYFGHGAWAFRYAAYLVPYLRKGFSRFDAFSSALGTYLDGKDTGAKARDLGTLSNALCTEGSRPDLAKLADWLRGYMKRVPAEEPALRTLLAQTSRPTCEDPTASKESPF